MKHLKLNELTRKHSTPVPAPPPPIPKFWIRKSGSTESVTNQEIAKFWRPKRIQEEDHLLAAIKAAAIVRARDLTKDEHKNFSLKKEEEDIRDSNGDRLQENTLQTHVAIKDWWTKSKYAYLNQPAMESKEGRRSSYIPNYVSYKPTSLNPITLVFIRG